MKKEKERQEPIRKSVHVDCRVEDAFKLFTEGFGEWWPLDSYSETGNEAQTCEMEPWVGGRVFERSRSGEERDWGSVIGWNPPNRVEFTFNPRRPLDDRQTVSVEFAVEADGTRVTLVHSGWPLEGVPVAASVMAMGGAPQLLELLRVCFAAFAAEQVLAAA